jgi:hypothetical protein
MILAIVSGLIALITPALINGYPLLNIDTATYLYAGKERFLPADRSYYYSFFIRHISMNYSLWFVVLMQAILLHGLIFLFIKKALQLTFLGGSFFSGAIVLFLSCFTSVAVFCSHVTPDIFRVLGSSPLPLYSFLN